MSTRNFQVAVRLLLLSFASNLEQVANLLCAQANSAFYLLWDGEWIVAYRLRGEVLVWLIGAMVCLLAANRGSSCSLTRAMDGRLLRCGIISSYRSAATFEIVNHFWATVRNAIASVGFYLFFIFANDVMFFPEFVCLSVCEQNNSKSYGRIFMECREWQKLQVIQFWGWSGKNPEF